MTKPGTQAINASNNDEVVLIKFAQTTPKKRMSLKPIKGSQSNSSDIPSSVGSLRFSMNVMLLTLVLYGITSVLPKRVRRYVSKINVWKSYKKRWDGKYKSCSNMVDVDDKSQPSKSAYYQNNKIDYHSKYSTNGKSLIDDEEVGIEQSLSSTDVNSGPRSRLLSARRPNYGSSLFVSTCSIANAGKTDNETLSPLDTILSHDLLFSVFREKSETKKDKKQSIDSNEKTIEALMEKSTASTNINEVNKENDITPTSQCVKIEVQQPYQTPSSVLAVSDVFSVDTSLISPPATIMGAVMNIKPDFRQHRKGILAERQISDNPSCIPEEEEEDYSISDITKTPYSSTKSYTTDRSKTSTKLEFTPSPLSIFTKRVEFSQAIVILISSDIIFQQQHDQQQNALMLLLSKKFHLPVKVVDANLEKDAMRREELFRISGLRGQYPQLFLVDSQRRLTYIGNHLSLEKMMKENVGQTLFSPSLITDGNKNGKDVDTSFFSV